MTDRKRPTLAAHETRLESLTRWVQDLADDLEVQRGNVHRLDAAVESLKHEPPKYWDGFGTFCAGIAVGAISASVLWAFL